MFRRTLVVLSIALGAPFAWQVFAQSDAQAALDKAAKAMNVDALKTVVVSGDGWDGCVGQAYSALGADWRRFSNKNYKRSIDFEAKGWRMERVRGEGESNGKLGGCSDRPIPDQPQNTVTMATNGNNAVEFALLPQGFVRIAKSKSDATVRSETVKGAKYTVVSYKGDNGQAVDGYIDEQGLVTRVATKIDNNVMGDMLWDATYTDWKDFNGTKFPTHVKQMQGGYGFAEYTFTKVEPNAAVDLAPPAGRGDAKGKAPAAEAKGKGDAKGKAAPAAAGGRGAAPAVASEDLGGGFWLVTGGYGSIIADFKQYIVIIEGPSNDARAEQIIAEAHRLVPNKPIKYVLNTHAHFDHSGGLRAFVAEGATIVTNVANKGFYEKTFVNAHSIVPDKLSKMSPQPKVKVQYAGDKKIFTDGSHIIEMYKIKNTMHSNDMMVVYLPKQKVLLEADEFNTGATPTPAPPLNPYHATFLQSIENLGLKVDRIVPVHLPNDNRKVTMAELRAYAGK